MEKVINILHVALHTMETNEPINRDEGNWCQAELEKQTALEIRAAIAVLTPLTAEAVVAKQIAEEMRAKEAAHAARQ